MSSSYSKIDYKFSWLQILIGYSVLIPTSILFTQDIYAKKGNEHFVFLGFTLGLLALCIRLTYLNIFSPRYIEANEAGLRFNIGSISHLKPFVMRFEDISNIRCISDFYSGVEFSSKNDTRFVHFNCLTLEDKISLLELIEVKLLKLSTQENLSILKSQIKKEKDLPQQTPKLVGIGSLLAAFFCFCIETNKQQETTLFIILNIAIAFVFAFFMRRYFYKKYPLRWPEHQKNVQGMSIFLFVGVFAISFNCLTILNQEADSSSSVKSFASVKREPSSDDSERGDCYIIEDNFSKTHDLDHMICSKEFPALHEAAQLEIEHKKGFLGQPWVSSIKFL